MEAPYFVKALYDYSSDHIDDLNFQAGQIIQVLAVEDDEWLKGSFTIGNGALQSGIFPKSFVELSQEPLAGGIAIVPVPHGPSETSTLRETETVKVNSTEDGHVLEAGTGPASFAQAITSPTIENDIPPQRSDTPTDEGQTFALPVSTQQNTRQGPKIGSPESRNITSGAATSIVSTEAQPKEITERIPSSKGGQEVHKIEDQSGGLTDGRTKVSKSDQTLPGPGNKPVKSNAFRDRIAAFNKQEAAPIAPKPMAKPSFAKKPFVAPPPSRDAFVPSPSQVKPKPPASTTIQGDVPTPVNVAEPDSSKSHENPPKIGSLKDRIAALQAERAQDVAKKSTPREEPAQGDPVDSPHMRSIETTEDLTPHSRADGAAVDENSPALHSRDARKGEEVSSSPPGLPGQEGAIGPEDAISLNSLARQDTSRSVDSVHSRRSASIPVMHRDSSASAGTALPVALAVEPFKAEYEESRIPQPTVSRSPPTADNEAEEVPSDDEIDPAELKKQQLRERMAKMSGGMGMGMHMALGFGGPRPNKPVKSIPASARHVENNSEEPIAPVPMPGLQVLPNSCPPVAVSIESPVARPKTPDPEVITSLASPPTLPSSRSTTIRRNSVDEIAQLDSRVSTLQIEPSQTESQSSLATIAQPAVAAGFTPPRPVARPPATADVPVPVPQGPPAIPSGRPVEQRPAPPAIPPNRPPPMRQNSNSNSSVHSSNQPRSSMEYSTTLPPPVPTSSFPSSRPLHSPGTYRDSPSSTPGHNNRTSYIGSGSPPIPPSRPSIDSSLRDSLDLSRGSFEAVPRTNSVRVEPPSRPPPPSVPATRAPFPPVPTAIYQSPVVPKPHAGFVEQQETYQITTPALPSIPAQTAPSVTHSSQPSMTENERKGYEADDDDTDVASMTRPSMSESIGRESMDLPPSGISSTGERIPNKKKGIKGLFKRKDKDAKVV